MKTRMLIEDRDLAYVVLDPDGFTDEDGPIVDFKLDRVRLDEAMAEGPLWVQNDMCTTIRVLPAASEQYDLEDDEFPIPSCVVVLDRAEYELHNKE